MKKDIIKKACKNFVFVGFLCFRNRTYLSIDPKTRFINVFKASFLSVPVFTILFTSKAPYIFEINSPITSNSSSFKEGTSFQKNYKFDWQNTATLTYQPFKELIVNENLKNININTYAYPDKFIQHGTVEELEKIYSKK